MYSVPLNVSTESKPPTNNIHMSDTFKARLRVPTAEQYSYIEIDVEGTPEAIIEAHRRFTGLVQGGFGLPEKEMNTFVDTMIMGQSVKGGVELYEQMNHMQKYAVQVLKRALKRHTTKEGRPIIEDK